MADHSVIKIASQNGKRYNHSVFEFCIHLRYAIRTPKADCNQLPALQCQPGDSGKRTVVSKSTKCKNYEGTTVNTESTNLLQFLFEVFNNPICTV